jgi:hypothetical protein
MDYKKYLNKRVMITTIRNSKYIGTLNGIWEKGASIHLIDLVICHKDGSYKAVSGNRSNNTRWFNTFSILSIEEYS